MLPNPQVLSQDSPVHLITNAVTFDKTGDDLSSSVYANAAAALGLPETLSVSHQTTKDGTRRHLIRLDKTVLAPSGDPVIESVYLNLVVPKLGGITADYLSMCSLLVCFMTFGTAPQQNIPRILNGEI